MKNDLYQYICQRVKIKNIEITQETATEMDIDTERTPKIKKTNNPINKWVATKNYRQKVLQQ